MKYKKLKHQLVLAVTMTITLTACQPFQSNQYENNSVQPIKVSKKMQTVQKQLDETGNNQETLQGKIRNVLLSSHLSGSAIAVQNNKILFQEGFGYADETKKLLNQPSTTYPIASITKIFVATSVMMLQEQDKLSIQDPVSKYLPNFPNGNQLTIYHLLTHTSGIQLPKWRKNDKSHLQLVQEIEKLPLKFEPGTQWNYLDANYIVLGYIVEKVTGKPLHNFIQENIFNKVHMENSGFITAKNPVPYTSRGYKIKFNYLIPSPPRNIYPLFACGDIYSTPYEMYLFDQALMSGKLVSKDSLKQMLTPGSISSYGLGLYHKGGKAYSRGILGGWYTMHAIYDDKISIVVFLNSRDKKKRIDPIVAKIHKIIEDSSASPTDKLMSKAMSIISKIKHSSMW